MSGTTVDAGPLIAFERQERAAVAFFTRAREWGDTIAIPAGVLAQVWRGGSQQTRLARLLQMDFIEVVALDKTMAKTVGQLCGVSGTADIVDASIVVCARQRKQSVLTHDPDDLRRIDPRLALETI